MFKRIKVLGAIVFVTFIFLLSPLNCFAGSCGTDPVISGVVTDCSDNSSKISGVKVSYYDSGSVYTDDNGTYQTTNAEEGWYAITYEKTSYVKRFIFGIWECDKTYTRDICLYEDSDNDGIADSIDNCINTPNGPDNGTCTAGDSGKIGDNCTDNGDCGTGGFCSMDQEDFDNDTIGDACDTCTDTDNDSYGNPGFPLNTCTEDNCPYIYNPGQDNTDNDTDGVPDTCDNCPYTPNGPDNGTCIDGENIGDNCTSHAGCGANGFCSMDQEITDNNTAGDAGAGVGPS